MLAIANATPGRQRRIADVNRILSEFGLAARLTRPGGRAQVADQPLTHNVRLQQLPGGISFWSFRDWELVTVSGEAAASADVAQNGRIFAVDGRMLVSSDKRVAGEFRQLLTNAVLWLAGKQ